MMSTMTARKDPVALKRLAGLVTQRRVALGMNKIEVARAAGITITTYSNIETGQSVRDSSYGKVEPVLGWAAGTCLDILDGADAAAILTEHIGPAVTSPVLPEDLTDDIEDIVQNAAIHVGDNLTASDIRDLKAEVTRLMRARGILPPRQEN